MGARPRPTRRCEYRQLRHEGDNGMLPDVGKDKPDAKGEEQPLRLVPVLMRGVEDGGAGAGVCGRSFVCGNDGNCQN